MTYDEAISYIHYHRVFGSRPGLSRITELCGKLSNPQKKTGFIHVAGTNGKGSVCAMLESVLRCAGLKTGLYTSPYISFFEERIKVNGESVSKPELAKIIERIKSIAEKCKDDITEFEIITAAAFVYFFEKKCDVVVLETGLGGRLDATNIIESPLLSVITGISLDHTEILGDTVEKIAYEKGGIIKSGCPVVLADMPDGAGKVLKDIAKNKNSPLINVDYNRIKDERFSVGGTSLSVYPYGRVDLALSGVYQAKNAMVAITAAEVLKENGLPVSEEDIKKGLYLSRWPARFETLSSSPLIIYDGAHNLQGAAALKQNINEILREKVILLTGIMADKDYREIAKTLSPCLAEVFTVTPDNPRALGASELCGVFKGFGVKSTACRTVKDGVEKAIFSAKIHNLPIVISGTLYIYKQITDVLEAQLK